MKKLFFTLVAIMTATLSFAQNNLVATLSHGNQVTMYYGVDAFMNAHNAAESGDVITLSGGAFTGFTITKGITVLGTGIDTSYPTSISSDMKIQIPANDTCRFSMEGIRFNENINLYFYGYFANPCLKKCQFYNVNFQNTSDGMSAIQKAIMIYCKITNRFYMYGDSSAELYHCYVNDYENREPGTSNAQFINCVVKGGYLSHFYRSSFVNSILIGNNNNGDAILPAETLAMNCTAFNYASNSSNKYNYNGYIYSAMQGNQISCTTSSYEEVFKDFRGEYNDSQTFELTNNAKTQFLGTDDTEIGLYGGQYPYNTSPTYPRITNLTVDKQTTADDKLNVEIVVSSAE